MALILRYFTKFGSFWSALCKSVRVRCHRKEVHVCCLICWRVSYYNYCDVCTQCKM